MGITTNSVECILSLRDELNFINTLLLGHQQFFDTQISRYCELIAKFGLPAHNPQHIGFTDSGYVDEWFRLLGANRLEILDANDYECATLIHDMNQPLTDEIHEICGKQMTLVFDGGSLEHIFNIPQALINISEMLTLGGHYLAILPCNNWGGHGFYQFNPELFYRFFEENAGFSNTRVWIINERGQLNI